MVDALLGNSFCFCVSVGFSLCSTFVVAAAPAVVVVAVAPPVVGGVVSSDCFVVSLVSLLALLANFFTNFLDLPLNNQSTSPLETPVSNSSGGGCWCGFVIVILQDDLCAGVCACACAGAGAGICVCRGCSWCFWCWGKFVL